MASESIRRRGSVSKAAAITGLHPKTISRRVKAGTFPSPTWIGSRRCWDLDEVERWVASQRKPERFNLPTRD